MASLKRRGKNYYAQFYLGEKQKRVCLHTTNLQLAKAKLRQIETDQAQGSELSLPTKTPIAQAVRKYIEYIKTAKSPRSVDRDTCILRLLFGPIITELEIVQDSKHHRRFKNRPRIQVRYLESITPAIISECFTENVKLFGLAPRTVNRYREVISRLFSWSMKCGGIRMPNDKNPVSAVQRYRQKAPQIRFLTLAQIDEQLNALSDEPQLQTMIAMYIYAGLRREEALWLQMEDVSFKSGSNGMLRIRAKEVNGRYWQPKTATNRAVPISSTLRRYLNAYTPKPSTGGWFFPSPQCSWYDPGNFSKNLAKHQRKNGLRWTSLDFRHTFGSQLAMKGESLYKISTLMGNSPEICRTHYAALIPEALGDSVEFIATKRSILSYQ